MRLYTQIHVPLMMNSNHFGNVVCDVTRYRYEDVLVMVDKILDRRQKKSSSQFYTTLYFCSSVGNWSLWTFKILYDPDINLSSFAFQPFQFNNWLLKLLCCPYELSFYVSLNSAQSWRMNLSHHTMHLTVHLLYTSSMCLWSITLISLPVLQLCFHNPHPNPLPVCVSLCVCFACMCACVWVVFMSVYVRHGI